MKTAYKSTSCDSFVFADLVYRGYINTKLTKGNQKIFDKNKLIFMFSIPRFFSIIPIIENTGIPSSEGFLNAMYPVASNDDEFCDNNFDFDAF